MSNLLKDQIDLQSIKKLAILINQQAPKFDMHSLTQVVEQPKWAGLPLMQRIRTLTLALNTGFKQAEVDTYPACLVHLKAVSIEFNGLFHFLFSDYVGCFGTNHYELSMQALALFTENSTAEFAIRPFLNTQPERTKAQMVAWSLSDNLHLRRLASEGVRPKLPWAKHLPWIAENPEWVRPIIENLKSDSSLYVRKSVANLLNDLSKTQADWVLDLCESWNQNKQACSETRWIIKHALRTLLKNAHPQALAIIGYASVEHLTLSNWQLDNQVRVGERLAFSFNLKTKQMVQGQAHSSPPLGYLRLEYAVLFLRKQRQPYRKVFKIGEGKYEPSERVFAKSHNFKPISTRTYYPGVHQIELLINGQVMQTSKFELKH